MCCSLGLLRSEEHTSELQSHVNLVCRLLLEKKKSKLSGIARGDRGIRVYFEFADVIARIRLGLFFCVAVDEVRHRHDVLFLCIFFFNDTATTEIYTLSLHDALPI